MTNTPEPDVASPCTGVCRLDDHTRWCVGCGRTASEIGRWSAAGAEEKRAILARLPERMRRIGNA